MLFRRRPVSHPAAVSRTRRSISDTPQRRQRAASVERLEARQLLTTVTGPGSFIFQDPRENFIQVNFFGNITAELIGATPGGGALTQMPGTLNGAPVNGGTATPVELFSIYVSDADENAGITIGAIASGDEPVEDPLAGELDGGIRTNLRAEDAEEDLVVNAGSATGLALLGAITSDTAGEGQNNRPVITLPINQSFGVLPGGMSQLIAGIQVA